MKHNFIRDIMIGILIGFVVCAIVFWIGDGSSEILKSYIPQFITVFVGLLALWGISRQVQANFQLEEKRRQAKLEAAKASLPIVLSNITELSRQRYHAVAQGNKGRPSPEARWEITDNEFQTLKECIEFSEGVEQRTLLQICRVYQVLIARWSSQEVVDLFNTGDVDEKSFEFVSRLNQFYAISNWVTLEALTASLFDFARNEQSTIEKASLRESVFMRMAHITSSGPNGKGGWALENNKNYADFVQRRRDAGTVYFIDSDWKM